MASNEAMSARTNNAADEFYTQLSDIEAELRYYRDLFRGQTVFCNCDDPYESNFFKYFAMNFNHLGLKKLITTSYAGSPIVGEQLPLPEFQGASVAEPMKPVYKVEITEVPDANNDGAIDLSDVEYLLRHKANVIAPLEGNGDFRSEECVALLDESDIVVTNPPFSLFREYVAQLVRHDKKFLIIGNLNAATYKEVWPLVQSNRMWWGPSISSGDRAFRVPDSYPLEAAGCWVDDDGIKWIRVKGVRWFTNLDNAKRHENLTLYKAYTPEEYPTYTNYPAINVSKVAEIPADYDGEMGVPITFLDKYNPAQFEIVGYSTGLAEPMSKFTAKENYATPEGKFVGGTGKFFIPLPGGRHKGVYDRIVIKRIGAAS